MTRYTPIPEIPLGGVSDWVFAVLSTMKENIDLLTGQRGESDGASAAISRSGLTVQPAPEMSMTQLTATGAGYTVQGVQVASNADHIALMTDVRTLAVDVANVRATLNILIGQLKG